VILATFSCRVAPVAMDASCLPAGHRTGEAAIR
jgi:hypothetical protein